MEILKLWTFIFSEKFRRLLLNQPNKGTYAQLMNKRGQLQITSLPEHTNIANVIFEHTVAQWSDVHGRHGFLHHQQRY